MSNTPNDFSTSAPTGGYACYRCGQMRWAGSVHECPTGLPVRTFLPDPTLEVEQRLNAEVERLQSEVQELKEKRDAEVRQSNAHFEETERNLYLRINDLEERNEKLESALKEYARTASWACPMCKFDVMHERPAHCIQSQWRHLRFAEGPDLAQSVLERPDGR